MDFDESGHSLPQPRSAAEHWSRALDLMNGEVVVPADCAFTLLTSSWSSEPDGTRKVTVVNGERSLHVSTYLNSADDPEGACRTALWEFLTNEIRPPRNDIEMTQMWAEVDDVGTDDSFLPTLASGMSRVSQIGDTRFAAWTGSVVNRSAVIVTVAGHRSKVMSVQLRWLSPDAPPLMV